MSSRVSGYRYVKGKDGKKHRVYNVVANPRNSIVGSGPYSRGRNVSRARALYGRGGYYDSGAVKFLKKYVPKNTFSSLGQSVAGPLGAVAGQGLSKLLGFGAYELSKNSLISEGEDPARMHSNSSCVKVRHREYITDIVSSGTANTFSLQSFSINPGLPTCFPWLSAIAAQYQEYKPLGIVFEFKTLSATAISSSTNTTMGGIIMATDYNTINPNFSNKQSMDNAEYTTSKAVWESFYHPIECDMKQNPLSTLYVRSGAVPAGSDQRMYDLGNFQIASFGVQGTKVVLGELWVSYEFELSKPISTSALGQDVLSDHFRLGSITNTDSLGSTSVLAAGSSIGGTISSQSGYRVYNFNPLIQEGTFLVSYLVVGTNTTLTAPTVTLTNCVGVNLFDADSGYSYSNSGANDAYFMLTMAIQVTGMNASFYFGGCVLPLSPGAGDLFVTQYDSNIVN